jgi:hypothetical protein
MGPSTRIAVVAAASAIPRVRGDFRRGLGRDHGDVLDADAYRSADPDRRADPQKLRPAAP